MNEEQQKEFYDNSYGKLPLSHDGDIISALTSLFDKVNPMEYKRDFARLSKTILKTVELCLCSQHSKAFCNLNGYFKEETDGLFLYSTEKYHKFYRMRVDDVPQKNFSADKMFHCPLNLRGKIAEHRYNYSGFPCLYISDSVYGCWEEMGRPHLNDCEVSLLNNQNKVEFYDLHIPSEKEFIKDIERYVKLFPLIAACSIKVKEYLDKYKPEYSVPQLIMEMAINWNNTAIKKNKGTKTLRINEPDQPDGLVTSEKIPVYRGIRYTSVHFDEKIGYPIDKAINYAIPIVDPMTKDIFCPELKKLFRISNPINSEFEKIKYFKSATSEPQDSSDHYSISEFHFIEERLENTEPLRIKEDVDKDNPLRRIIRLVPKTPMLE